MPGVRGRADRVQARGRAGRGGAAALRAGAAFAARGHGGRARPAVEVVGTARRVHLRRELGGGRDADRRRAALSESLPRRGW